MLVGFRGLGLEVGAVLSRSWAGGGTAVRPYLLVGFGDFLLFEAFGF